MLEAISLENFKSFKNLEELTLRPITILCGTNSCGKSSILQSILLLKQTIESQNPNQTLLLNGRLVRLGSFESIIFERNVDNKLIFDLTFKLPKEAQRIPLRANAVPLIVLIRDLYPEIQNALDQDIGISLRISLKAPKLSSKRNKVYLKAITVEQFKFTIEVLDTHGQVSSSAFIDVKLSDNGLYTIIWDNIRSRIGRKERSSQGELTSVHVRFASLFSIGFVSARGDAEKNVDLSDLSFALYRVSNIFQTIFSSYSYIGPLREEPSRRYIYEDEITEIGVKGENAAYIYLTDQDRTVANHYFYDRESDSFRGIKKTTLAAAVQEWLDLMNIKGFKSEVVNEVVYLNLSSGSAPATRVSIADVGFGVSQIFPIILEGLRMPRRNTLLLEQPEIHLHPNLQMQLSDYFITLALSDKRVMVETHSDHIINRLVRRIVEDKTGMLQKLIGIYFVSSSDKGSIYEEVCIDETLGVTNWPVGFFDQAASEQEKIMRAGLKKRQSSRGRNHRID
ncbi:MAG: DUF3696 domain-containing protein [Leptolyngbyaceae cyanobacterium]